MRRDGSDLLGFNQAFAKGPITVPSGTAFVWVGNTFGAAADPLDETHSLMYPALGWRGMSKAAGDQRMQQMLEDTERQKGPTSALVTLADVRLTKARPCSKVPVAAAISIELRWVTQPVVGDPAFYYQAYGVVRDGTLNTNWSTQPPALRSAGIDGALNGVLKGTTDRQVEVQQ